MSVSRSPIITERTVPIDKISAGRFPIIAEQIVPIEGIHLLIYMRSCTSDFLHSFRKKVIIPFGIPVSPLNRT